MSVSKETTVSESLKEGKLKTIGICSDASSLSERMGAALCMKPGFHGVLISDPRELAYKLNTGEIDGLALGMRELRDGHFHILANVKRKVPDCPMVIVSEVLSPLVQIGMDAYQNVSILRYPKELGDIGGVFEKLFQKQKVYPRNHIRHRTELRAAIRNCGQESDIGGNLKNLSEGGACVEIYGRRVEIGTKAELEIPLFELNKKHTRSGKVVWIKDFCANHKIRVPFQQVGFAF